MTKIYEVAGKTFTNAAEAAADLAALKARGFTVEMTTYQAEADRPLTLREKLVASLEIELYRLEHGLAMPYDADAVARCRAMIAVAKGGAL